MSQCSPSTHLTRLTHPARPNPHRPPRLHPWLLRPHQRLLRPVPHPGLPASPLAIHGFDQRGWGRSVHVPADAGLTGPTPQVLDDIHSFMLSVATQLQTDDGRTAAPLFLMGHSMGGGETLHVLLSIHPNYLAAPLPPLSGCILESPYIALHPSSQPSSLVVSVGKLAGRLLPNRQMKQKLDATYMSRDAQVRQDWIDDPLCHDIGTLAGLSGMLGRAADLVALTHGPAPHHLTTKLPCPVLMCHGDGDRVTSHDATKALCEKMEGEKTFVSYPGCYHKMHAEPEGKGEEFARDVGAWIVKMAQRHTEDEVREYMAGEGQEQHEVRHLKL